MSFLNPWFFLGALAAAVPVLLHLVKREQAQKIQFSTLMFLRRISKKTIRYQKLRQLLLLLLRILAILLLVLAFVRPYLQHSGAAAVDGRVPAAHIILIDNSMSMGYSDYWLRAKNSAIEIARSAQPGDKVALLEFSDVTLALTGLTAEIPGVINQIREGLELTDRPTQYMQALKAAERVALDAEAGRRIIHMISDFQKNGVEPEAAAFHLDSRVDLKYKDVGSDDFSNLTLGDVRVIEGEEIAGNSLKIKASVINYGSQDRKSVRVTLAVDGRPEGEQRVDVLKGEVRGVEFLLPGLSAGAHQMVLETEDPLQVRDNRFQMMVEARGKTPVTAIEEQGAGRANRAPSFFIAHALNISTQSHYRLSTLPLQKAQAGSMPPGGLWIWNNASGGGAQLQKGIQDFVRRGGGLAIVLADSALSADFNRSFGAWIPVKVSESSPSMARSRQDASDYRLLTDLRLDHPIFEPFRDADTGIFSQAKFFNHAKLVPSRDAEILARFDNGDPALVAFDIEKGRVVVLAFSADDSGSDLPLKAVFAPFWQQLLRHLEHYQEARHSLEVGETIAPRKLLAEAWVRLGRQTEESAASIVVLDPTKQRLNIGSQVDSVIVDKAGFYEVRSSDFKLSVAVNPVLRESDLTHGNAEELVASWTVRGSGTPSEPSLTQASIPEDWGKKQRYWQFLLLASLVLLIAEGILANRATANSS